MTAERHLAKALSIQGEIDRAERAHARHLETLKRRRRRAWLQANREGMTYDKLVERTGVSDGYLCREIRVARQEGPEQLRDRPTRTPAANGARTA